AGGLGQGGTVLLGLQWTNTVVTYAAVQVGSGGTAQYELVRRFCGATTGVQTLAHNLSGISPGPATVTCGPTIVSCSVASWLSTAGVSAISQTVTEPLSGYNFTLSATPRNSNTTSCGTGCGGGTPLPQL